MILRSSPSEFAGVFLGDIENLIDHCFEQFVEIQRLSSDTDERSDAWGVVTIYYYAFFAAQTLLRLLGHPVLFLDMGALNPLKGLAGTNLTPGGGSFSVSLVANIGPTDAEFELGKLDACSHNAVWAAIFRVIRSELALVKQAGAISSEEEIFYGGLCSTAAYRFYVNDDWPAKIRHKANYVPGFCYSLVGGGNALAKCKKMLEGWKMARSEHFHTLVDKPARDFKNCNENDFEQHVRLLSDMGHGLFTLARRFYLDLYGRRDFDKRWENRRIIFLKRRPKLESYKAMFMKL
jgi:hypothetical protein